MSKPKKAPIEREVRVIVPVEPDRIYWKIRPKNLLRPLPYRWELESESLKIITSKIDKKIT